MKSIPFTRFHLPNARQTETSMPVDDETFAQYEIIAGLGFRLTVEMLRDGMISQCIEDPKLGDFDCVVCTNGPDVPAKTREMLLRFTPEDAAEWRRSVS